MKTKNKAIASAVFLTIIFAMNFASFVCAMVFINENCKEGTCIISVNDTRCTIRLDNSDKICPCDEDDIEKEKIIYGEFEKTCYTLHNDDDVCPELSGNFCKHTSPRFIYMLSNSTIMTIFSSTSLLMSCLSLKDTD